MKMRQFFSPIFMIGFAIEFMVGCSSSVSQADLCVQHIEIINNSLSFVEPRCEYLDDNIAVISKRESETRKLTKTEQGWRLR